MSEKLKRCPICGGEAHRSPYDSFACCSSHGCALSSQWIQVNIWHALPRRNESVAEVWVVWDLTADRAVTLVSVHASRESALQAAGDEFGVTMYPVIGAPEPERDREKAEALALARELLGQLEERNRAAEWRERAGELKAENDQLREGVKLVAQLFRQPPPSGSEPPLAVVYENAARMLDQVVESATENKPRGVPDSANTTAEP